MKASDLNLSEVIEFKEGNVNLHGRRLVIHDIHAMAQFRKELINKAGVKTARQILTRFGFYAGEADAAAMKRLFKWENLTEWAKSSARMQNLQGSAKAVFKKLDIDLDKKRYHAELCWHNSAEAEEHMISFKDTDYSACWILSGYASGYASYCLEKEVFFIERKCKCQQSQVCVAEGKDIDSWGNEIDEYLYYFKGDNILQKVQVLTNQLKEKDKKILAQQKKIEGSKKTLVGEQVEIKSSSFRKVFETAARVSHFDSYVLISGESGTGKEVLAKFIHKNSERSKMPFVAINCGALPDTLLEGELFGYKAGSFTGAVKDRIGLLEQADGGIIFLDEVGDISPAMQIKLLRVLQEQEVLRLGENIPRKISIRVIAASNKNLHQEIVDNKFREDLYYRLAIVEIEIPPLRERSEDILPLVRFFVKKLAKKLKIHNLHLDATCIDYLLAYNWPGNIRELENTIERAAVFSAEGLITISSLPAKIVSKVAHGNYQSIGANLTLAEMEQQHIMATLKTNGSNKTKTAQALGISQVTLWRKLSKF